MTLASNAAPRSCYGRLRPRRWIPALLALIAGSVLPQALHASPIQRMQTFGRVLQVAAWSGQPVAAFKNASPAAVAHPASAPPSSTEHAAQQRSTHEQTLLKQKLREDRRRLEEDKRQQADLTRTPVESVRAASMDSQITVDSSAARGLREQIAEARQRLADLQSKDTDLHPDVIAARAQIADLQKRLDEALATSPAHAPAAAKATSEPGRKAKLSQMNAAIEQREQAVADDQRQLDTLRQDKPQPSSLPQRRNLSIPTPVHEAPVHATKAASVAEPLAPPLAQPAESPAPPARANSRPSHASTAPLVPASGAIQKPVHVKAVLGLVVGVSLLLLVLAVFLIVARRGRDTTIKNAAMLRGMLPKDIDYVGSIPRMSRP